MPRFLHIADIHLGYDRYDNKMRSQDFFLAFSDVLDQYAIAESVDFVLIAGDLFEHRNIQPAVLNQAKLCLQKLQEQNIPAIAIEGNHDNRPYGTKTSWLRYLAEWGHLILLEPGDTASGESFYRPWDGLSGGYIDLDCGVRVIGSQWYGASAPKAIAQIADAIQTLPTGPEHTILLFHHGLQHQIARYQGALRYEDILPLKESGVDYLALGHIHKNYEEEGWVFNPGSLEANNVEESRYERGAYLVELTDTGIQATLKRDYRQRSIVRLQTKASEQASSEDLEQAAIATVQTAIDSGDIHPDEAPVVELRLEGSIGFERSDLDVRALETQLKDLSGALIFLLRYNVESLTYSSPIADDATRLQVEQEIFTDLLAANNHYKKRAENLAQGLIELKQLQLDKRPEDELYQFVEDLMS